MSSENKIVWLEKGDATTNGWKHILKHKSEKPFLGKSDTEIQKIVFENVKDPSKITTSEKQIINGKESWKTCYFRVIEEKLVVTVVGGNGYILSSHTTDDYDCK